jgi:hypothetical protein
MNLLRIACVPLLIVTLASCGNPQKKRLMDEYDKNEKVLRWFKEMKPIWDSERELGRRTYQAILDSLESERSVLVRQKQILDSIQILEGKDPDAWKKRPE